MGKKNRAPRKGEQLVTMYHGDAVNIVDVSGNNTVDHDKEFTVE
jgi:hypothetical protein